MGWAGSPEQGRLAATIRSRVSRFAPRFVGLSVGMLDHDGQATVGFGRTRAEGAVPDGRTSFQIGSVTKLFTALLLADAIHRGEVTLDQPLTTLIPGVAAHPRGQHITLVDLATHSAGLPRLPPGLRRQALTNRADPYAGFTVDQLTDALRRRPKRPAGTRVRYSNFGAGVLGEALARAAGKSYHELIATRICEPLGMHDTAVHMQAGSDRIAAGHTRRRRPVGDWHLSALAGAGALRSSANDLLTFLRAHLHPDTSPLSAQVRLVVEPRRRANRQLRIALGWHVLDRKAGSSWWWHNGGTGGFCSFVGIDPTTATGVVVLANSARPVDRLGVILLEAESQFGGTGA